MNWNEIISKKAQAGKDVVIIPPTNGELAKQAETKEKEKQKNDEISRVQSTWETEIFPLFEILEKCEIEGFLIEVNNSSFAGKGKVSRVPKDIDKYRIYTRPEDHKYVCEYTSPRYTLSAKFLAYKPEEDEYDCEGDGYIYLGRSPEGIIVKNIKISFTVNSKDKSISLLYCGDYDQSRYEYQNGGPYKIDLNNQNDIDQQKEKMAKDLAAFMVNDESFPFTSLSKDAMRVLKENGTANYIQENILKNYDLSKLTNGDKIRVEGMKERRGLFW